MVIMLVVCGCTRGETPSHFDLQDRFEIENLLSAYSHTIDHGQIDEYVQLFTGDAVFETHFPGLPAMTFTGHGEITPLATGARDLLQSGVQRRHRLTNILFHEQAETSAHISCYLLLTATTNEKDLSLSFTGQYDGWLVKTDDGWKIDRWVLTSDSGLAQPAAASGEQAPGDS